ncbi:MAG TPA: HEXXH motif-containing putative peptide modification protein [Verrucomicrobiae bacterium]|nr:HEXXH motif-containing putative peptide modification protein [Verrucomicrobiae bacterium]
MNSISSTSPVLTVPDNLHAFTPNADRARFLDHRMRQRLAQSLRYIRSESDGQLSLESESFGKFLAQLESRTVSPLAFTYYNEAVLAIEEDDLDRATRLLRDMSELPPPATTLQIQELANPTTDFKAELYVRAIDTDPGMKFQVFPPPPHAAAACREQINQALRLMQEGDPELAAEIPALLREIILAAGSEDPKAFTFDGGSSFMLWGAILINANRRDGELAMAQMLAHESAHNLLFGFSANGPLVENTADELYPSPLRADPRPMDGIYHATFVTARMYRVMRTLLDSGILSREQEEKARKDLAEDARLFQLGIDTVQKYARLTEVGEAVIQGATDYMADASR